MIVNLFKTKLDAIHSSIQKYLNDINYDEIFLKCLLILDDNTRFEQIIQIYSFKDKIYIEKIEYEFELEKYFLHLFVNDIEEFVK